jgi:hypothetical protein
MSRRRGWARREAGQVQVTILGREKPIILKPPRSMPTGLKRIVDAKAQFGSVEPSANTGTGRRMIAVLGRFADVERDLIRTRTAEARSRTHKRGQHMGRGEGRGPPATGGRCLHLRKSRAATAFERARFRDCDDETSSS